MKKEIIIWLITFFGPAILYASEKPYAIEDVVLTVSRLTCEIQSSFQVKTLLPLILV